MKNKYAVIDIGTLKVKFLLAEVNESRQINVLNKESILTCLGKKNDNRRDEIIIKSPVEETVSAIIKFKKYCQENRVKKIKVVATESLRCLEKSKKIIDYIQKETGFDVRIISQDEEAEIFFKAVIKSFEDDKVYALVDMGGGSVQMIIGNKRKVLKKEFLKLGVYDLQQRFVSNSTPKGKATDRELKMLEKYISDYVDKLIFPNIQQVPLIYGSSNILDLFKFINLKVNKFKCSSTHPVYSSPLELKRFLNEINEMTHEEREKKYPFQFGYMWGIQMAFLNIYYLAKKLGTNIIIPSNVNISEGYIYEMLNGD